MATFTKKPTSDGNVQIFKDGQLVSTAAAANADSVISSLGGGADAPASSSSSSTNPITSSTNRRYTGTTADGSVPSPYVPPAPTPARSLDEIRADELNRIQDQLDAIDTTYAGVLADVKAQGQENLGRGRSLNARSGLLGSDMGDRRTQDITKLNQQQEQKVLAERDTLKANVMGAANDRAVQIAQLESNKAATDTQNYLAAQKNAQDAARADIKTLAGGGVALDSLSDAEYTQLLKQSGMDELTFTAYYNSSLPANQQKTYQYINAGDGKIVRVDPTGATDPKTFDAGAPDGYSFQMAGDIPLWINPKTQDVKLAVPAGTPSSGAGAFGKETELDTYTNAEGKRVSVLYNPITKTTRSIVLGQTDSGGNSFKPQAFESSAVNQYIASEGRKQGQSQADIDAALKMAQSDPGFFYSTLSVILGDQNLSSLYYKPTTLAIPASFAQPQ